MIDASQPFKFDQVEIFKGASFHEITHLVLQFSTDGQILHLLKSMIAAI